MTTDIDPESERHYIMHLEAAWRDWSRATSVLTEANEALSRAFQNYMENVFGAPMPCPMDRVVAFAEGASDALASNDYASLRSQAPNQEPKRKARKKPDAEAEDA